MRIKDLPLSIRPRERGLRLGTSSLSDAELVSILLRSGRKGLSASDMSQRLLVKSDGSLETLSHFTHEEMKNAGLGDVQLITLLSAFELGRRLQTAGRDPSTLEEALDEVSGSLLSVDKETFVLIPLDLRNKCVRNPLTLSRGTRYQVVVDPKEVLHAAISCRAARIVVVHNHPSNDSTPSPQDVLLTKQLMEACQWSDIEFWDHCIVTKKERFSFREKGFLS